MKAATDLSPTEDKGELHEFETIPVVVIATGNIEEDRRLAAIARGNGQKVLLTNLPQESDLIVNSPRPTPESRQTTSPLSGKPFSWDLVQKKIWAATFRPRTGTETAMNIFAAIALMIIGHVLFTYVTFDRLTLVWNELSVSEEFFYFLMAGFIAQMIDGALGMAYGVTASTFLLTIGVPPAAVSASVHTSEIFTSGVSGYMHLKFGNVNSKLFKKILIPGVIGAITGAYLVSSLEQYIYIIKPLVALYTLILGILIIQKALKKRVEKRPIKKIGWLAWAGGTLDSIGGGGWGPIVTSTLIARGRHPKYTIGSVNLAEFFVSLASSVTFITLIGFSHWQVVLGLILGGMTAAPIAVSLSRRLPIKTMMILVGTIVIIVSLRIIYMVWFGH
ncbi:hypothetical protein CLV98_10213 [Dyadobacter jejuensis]|uniref:Probable membrane transporter protein n=1 Tax=Dyadobacter jejuensis TaxID=1082580 RepID=A0A316ANW7_9BACT|nr:sulfite exporter TauE/SafE family protein [Dyadobacter jejuensis]PWJ59181.1 hypothetical protein CLV98_10213 [Dyadobacter jejuensis]